MGCYRACEGAFCMAEEFGFDKRFGILREVYRDTYFGEAFGEGVFLFVEWYETASSDGGGCGAFSASGRAEQEG